MSKTPMEKYALVYLKSGFNVIPVKANKRSFIEWKKYQTERVTEKEINDWWGENGRFKGSNIAIITGEISGLSVVDIDLNDKGIPNNEMIEGMDCSAIVKTGSGGFHYYFKYCDEISSKRQIKEVLGDKGYGGVDVKSKGGYVLAPPSKNEKGSYLWSGKNNINALNNFPLELLAKLSSNSGEKKNHLKNTNNNKSFQGLPVNKPSIIQELIKNGVDISDFRDIGNGELQGINPFHGSETGVNMTINEEKGVWNCFRHGNGGDVYSMRAIFMGLASCGDCKLSTEVFKKVAGIDTPTINELIKDSENKEEEAKRKTAEFRKKVIDRYEKQYNTKWKFKYLPLVKTSEYRTIAKDNPYLIKEILCNETTLLSAESGVGKSIVAMLITKAVITGKPFIGDERFKVRGKGEVFYLNFEIAAGTVLERADSLIGEELDSVNWFTLENNNGDFNVKNMEQMEALISQINTVKPKLVILDTLSRVHDSKENDAGEMKEVMKIIKAIQTGTNTTLLIVHHNNKGGGGTDLKSIRGSSEIIAICENVIILTKGNIKEYKTQLNETVETYEFTLHYPKCRTGEKPEERFRIGIEHCYLTNTTNVRSKVKSKKIVVEDTPIKRSVKEVVLDSFEASLKDAKTNLSYQEIFDYVCSVEGFEDTTMNTIKVTVKRLRKSGEIIKLQNLGENGQVLFCSDIDAVSTLDL